LTNNHPYQLSLCRQEDSIKMLIGKKPPSLQMKLNHWVGQNFVWSKIGQQVLMARKAHSSYIQNHLLGL